jgi:glyoxylase-like metal-dependent hydrolase (beta-lactamase superfamily II)
MNINTKHQFGEVAGFEMGYGPVGRPLMSVFFYYLDGLLIDSGQSRMRKTILDVLSRLRIDRILLTHHHEDHSGNAAVIGAVHGAQISGHPLTIEKMKSGFSIMPYQRLIWGRAGTFEGSPLPPVIETDNYRLMPVHTPGHSRDHVVYLEKSRGWLFSGDLYLGPRIKYFRADERMGDTITSIKRVLEYDFDVLFCGHRPQRQDGRKRLREKLAFLENICGSVAELMGKGYDQKMICKRLVRHEERFVKCLTFGNVSFSNLIRSAIESVRENKNIT